MMKKIVMKNVVVAVAAGSVLSITSQAVLAEDGSAGRAQSMQQATEQMRERQQIYGSQLMSEQERAEYRARMQNAKTNEEREALRREHHTQMQERAKERGAELPDMPMPQGPGGGQGRGR